jgi:phosphatidylserine synthase
LRGIKISEVQLSIIIRSFGVKDFTGFPIPAAAGLVASLTLFLMWWSQRIRTKRLALCAFAAFAFPIHNDGQ